MSSATERRRMLVIIVAAFIVGCQVPGRICVEASQTTKDRSGPYVLMVTSMDGQQISSTPLLDITPEMIETVNDSPYDGIALEIMDMRSGQPVPDREDVIRRAETLKAASTKHIWPRVELTRIIRRSPDSHSAAYCYEEGWTMDDVLALGTSGVSQDRATRVSTAYFKDIKGYDLYDEQGALTDFYALWRLALIFAKRSGSPGIVFDPESYHDLYRLPPTSLWQPKSKAINLCESQGKSEEEVKSRIREIAAKLVDIAVDEYPEAQILFLYTYLSQPTSEIIPEAILSKGMLERARDTNARLELIEGGEGELKYINTMLEKLRERIRTREEFYKSWLPQFPQLRLGGTITVWDDPKKTSGWVSARSARGTAFPSIDAFEPFLAELFAHYDIVWIYHPMIIGVNPFDPDSAPPFNEKLSKVLKNAKLQAQERRTSRK